MEPFRMCQDTEILHPASLGLASLINVDFGVNVLLSGICMMLVAGLSFFLGTSIDASCTVRNAQESQINMADKVLEVLAYILTIEKLNSSIKPSTILNEFNRRYPNLRTQLLLNWSSIKQ